MPVQLAILNAKTPLLICCSVQLLKFDFVAFYSDPRSPLRAEQSMHLLAFSVVKLPSNANRNFLLYLPLQDGAENRPQATMRQKGYQCIVAHNFVRC